MLAFLNKNNHKGNNDDRPDHDDDDEKGDNKLVGSTETTTTTKGGGDIRNRSNDDFLGDEEGDALPAKLSIQQRSTQKMRASSTSSLLSVETNEEYDKIVKELAADAGSSDDDDDDDDDDDGSDEDENVIMKPGMVKEDFLDMIAPSKKKILPMGGNKVDHPIQASKASDGYDVIGGTPEQRGEGGEENNSGLPPTNNSPLVHDDEEETGESLLTTDANYSGPRKQGKSTRLQLNRRKNLTRLLADLAGKAQSMRESLTDPHAKDYSKAAVDAMEKMAATGAADVDEDDVEAGEEETDSTARNTAREYHPPSLVVPEEDDPKKPSSSQSTTEQDDLTLQRKAGSLDGSGNYYYLPTKSMDGKQSPWKLPTLPRHASTRKGNTSHRRASVESESMWTRQSSGSSSSGGLSHWLRSSLNKNNHKDNEEENTANGGGHDEREGGFNDSQLSLSSDMVQDHTIDEESLQDILNDIIRGRPRRRREEGAPPGVKEEDEVENDEDESPFHFERSANQFYRPSQRTLHRCIGMVFVVVVMIVSAALIGTSVRSKKHVRGDDRDAVPNQVMTLTTTGNTTMDETISTIIASLPHGQYTKSDLFYMAKSVSDNCHADQFVTVAGRWECQHICHAHFCCFDYDDEDSNYNCLDDVNKLCPIFAGCEILVSHDFLGSGSYSFDGLVNDESHEEEPDQQPDSGEESSPSKNKDAQEVIKENELGWQEVRRSYINAHCDESNLATDTGRKQCEKACDHHYCCFDTGGGGSCSDNPSMTCHVYAACQALFAGQLGDDESANGSDSSTVVTTALPIPPDMLGDVVLPLNANGDESDEPTQYTNDELIQMQADVKERCSDTQSPTGRFQCENICQFHYCCFGASTGGCLDDPTKLCAVYDFCKVLMQPLSSSVENKEEESTTPQMALISADEAYKEMGTYAPAQSFVVVHDSYSPSQSAIVVHDSYAPAQSVSVIHESFAPTPIPTPTPIVVPITPSPTLPPIGMITAITSTSTSTHGDKPPPRPPIRCVPDGDDVVNIEVFNDDWNDDRFDRCARWESKYNMTVTEYWDLYGVHLN